MKTNNNQEVRNFIEERCDECGNLNTFKNEYALQECNHCNSKILAGNHKKSVKIEKIHQVNTAYNLIGSYDFQMPFDFKNSEEINEFLDKELICHHMIFCEVNCTGGEFDLDHALIGVSWYTEDSCTYDFTKEQIDTIKNNVAKYILQNNLGKIKDIKRDLLEKVCEYYGCGLTIASDGSVLLEDFIDKKLNNVTDTLIMFYVDFLKEEWNDKKDLKLIEDLIEDKALNTVLNWMDDYSYHLISKTRDGNNLILKVEDLELNPDDEDCITKHTLDYWCKYFIEEIENKDADEEVRQEWMEEDVEPMKLYLSRNEASKKEDNLTTSKPQEANKSSIDDNASISNKDNAVKLEVKYDINLSLEFKDNVYVITSSLPITVLLKERKVDCIDKLHFVKVKHPFVEQEYEYILEFAETIQGEKIDSKDIKDYLNMSSKKFLNICYELCDSYVLSYLKVKDEVYYINNVIDFLKIKGINKFNVSDIEYSFNLKEKDILNSIMDSFCKGGYEGALEKIKQLMIIGKNIEDAAKKYVQRVLKIDDTQLMYMDYVAYFNNEVSYEIIDDYIVVYI